MVVLPPTEVPGKPAVAEGMQVQVQDGGAGTPVRWGMGSRARYASAMHFVELMGNDTAGPFTTPPIEMVLVYGGMTGAATGQSQPVTLPQAPAAQPPPLQQATPPTPAPPAVFSGDLTLDELIQVRGTGCAC